MDSELLKNTMIQYLFGFILLVSTSMYLYLHYKTHMNLRFLYIDNLIVTVLSCLAAFLFYSYTFSLLAPVTQLIFSLMIGIILVIILGYALTMIRFWHTPKRRITAKEDEIISPADGNIIYIKKIAKNEVPISIKKGKLNNLNELTKSSLLQTPCWLIGINMTPWDVHKNCAPINGKIILNKYTKGSFLSLKKFEAITRNERNTFVIENRSMRLGVVQIASKGVRRIDTYIQKDTIVKKGDWLGMIRFGSQVDVILPEKCNISIKLGEQVYAAKTIIASF